MTNKNNTAQRMGAAELIRKFNTEKEAKNRAYHFILHMGLLDEFRAFCHENRNTDPHAGCIFEILRMDIDRTAV